MTMLRNLLLATAVAVPAGSAVAQDLTTVNMINPLPRSANFYPLIVAEALGYFEEEGVEVNLLPSSTTIPFVAFAQNGQADLAMLDPTEVVNAIAADAEIEVVYEVMQSAPEGIAVFAESDVQSVADLEGTTVGLVSDRDRNTLAIALGSVGLTIDDVTTVVVGEAGPTLANAIQNQTVSAISGAVPDWLSIQANGIGIRLITPEVILQQPANSFVINSNREDELREPVQGFLRAWSKGMYVASFDPEAVAAMAKAAVPEEWEVEEFGQQFLDASIPMNLSVTERPGDLQPELWESIQENYISVGAIEEVVPVDTFLNDSFIEFANDFDRAEIEAEVEAWKAENM